MFADASWSEWLWLARGAGSRAFSVEGAKWLVFELPAAPFDREIACSLIFENDMVIRRVRTFPPAWRTLSDAELAVLSWTR